MNQKKIWANLAVSDLDRTTKFYTELGFKPNGSSKELTSFLFGESNFVMHFFLKEVIENKMKIKINNPKNGIEVLFTLSAESRIEVDKWAKEV